VAEAHHDLGFMDYESGRWLEAAESYRHAVALAPRYVEALHGVCISLARTGRCDEAAAACRSCLAVAPADERCAISLRGSDACHPRSGVN
jgi:Flp pilus assembly protein TadD